MPTASPQFLQGLNIPRGPRPLFSQLCHDYGIRKTPYILPEDRSEVTVELVESGDVNDYVSELDRDIAVSGPALRRHLDNIMDNAARLEAELQATKNNARDAQARDERLFAEQNAHLQRLEASAADLEAQLRDAQAQHASLSANLTNAESELSRGNKAFEKLKARLNEREVESNKLLDKIGFLQNELKLMKKEKDELRDDWAKHKTRADNLDVDLMERDDNIKALQAEITRLNNLPKPQPEFDRLNAEIDRLEGELAGRNTENDDLRTHNSKLEEDLASVRKQLAELPGLSVRRTRHDTQTNDPVAAGPASKTPSPDPRRASLALELQNRESSGEYEEEKRVTTASSDDEEGACFDPQLPVVADEPRPDSPTTPFDAKLPATADELLASSMELLPSSKRAVTTDKPRDEKAHPDQPHPEETHPKDVPLPPSPPYFWGPASSEKPPAASSDASSGLKSYGMFDPDARRPSPPQPRQYRSALRDRLSRRTFADQGPSSPSTSSPREPHFAPIPPSIRKHLETPIPWVDEPPPRRRYRQVDTSTQTLPLIPTSQPLPDPFWHGQYTQPAPQPAPKPTPAPAVQEVSVAELGAHWPTSLLNLIFTILLVLMAYQWTSLAAEKGVWMAANEITREYVLRVRQAQAEGGAWAARIVWALERVLVGGSDRGLLS